VLVERLCYGGFRRDEIRNLRYGFRRDGFRLISTVFVAPIIMNALRIAPQSILKMSFAKPLDTLQYKPHSGWYTFRHGGKQS